MKPIDEQYVRMELLLGGLFDVQIEARELLKQLKLRANASAATRSDLDFLKEMQGSIWQHLARIHTEVEAIKNGNRWGD